LAQFQSTVALERGDMLKLVHSLNASCTEPLDQTRLERAFEWAWGDLRKELQELHSRLGSSSVAAVKRTSDDILAELLNRMRDLQRTVMYSYTSPRRSSEISELFLTLFLDKLGSPDFLSWFSQDGGDALQHLTMPQLTLVASKLNISLTAGLTKRLLIGMITERIGYFAGRIGGNRGYLADAPDEGEGDPDD